MIAAIAELKKKMKPTRRLTSGLVINRWFASPTVWLSVAIIVIGTILPFVSLRTGMYLGSILAVLKGIGLLTDRLVAISAGDQASQLGPTESENSPPS